MFWTTTTVNASKYSVNEPTLPRKRKRPARFEDGTAPAEFLSSTEDYYRKIYFEVIDHLIIAITERFDQPGYKVYSKAGAGTG